MGGKDCLDKDNKVVAWRHRSAAPSFMANFVPDPKYPGAIELGMGFVDTPFNVPNVRLESGEAQSHVRVGWFRSVNNVAHAWAIQSFVAEIAPSARSRSEGFPAGADRAGAYRERARKGHDAMVGLWRTA